MIPFKIIVTWTWTFGDISKFCDFYLVKILTDHVCSSDCKEFNT